MQIRHKKKMDIEKYKHQRTDSQNDASLYFVVGKGKNEKKLQIMSLPAGKIRVQYPV